MPTCPLRSPYGLRYAFFGEREAKNVPGIPANATAQAINTAAVIGAGPMGGGIAMSFADFGIPVKILEATQEALDRGMKRIRDNYATSVKRGSLAQEGLQGRQGGVADMGGKAVAAALGAGGDEAEGLEELGQADGLVVAVALPLGLDAIGGFGAIGALHRLGSLGAAQVLERLRALALRRLGHEPRGTEVLQTDAHAHGEKALPELSAGGEEKLHVIARRLGDLAGRKAQLVGAGGHGLEHLEVWRAAEGCGLGHGTKIEHEYELSSRNFAATAACPRIDS